MTPRSIRRAAERKALKAARKLQHNHPVADVESCRTPQSEPNALASGGSEATPEPTPITPARLAANTANAQLSTGPRTPEGKAKSSVNAIKTALTGRTVLLPTDDVAAYQQHVQNFADEFKPMGPHESELVQALADHAWRLNRIASLEMAIYAYGHEQFAEQFANRGEMQAGFIQMHTFLHYEKQLRNLQIQEARLRRNREKDTAELRRLQQERVDAAALQTTKVPNRAARVTEPLIPASTASPIGFDFSSPLECPEPVVPTVRSATALGLAHAI